MCPKESLGTAIFMSQFVRFRATRTIFVAIHLARWRLQLLIGATQWLRAKCLRLSHDGRIGTVAATGKEPHHLEAARCRSLFSPTLPGRTPARADFSLLAGI